MGLFTKIALFAVNFVVLCLGITILVLASILINEGVDVSFLIDDNTFSLPIFALVIGILILVAGFLGCFGAFREKKHLLYAYVGILTALLIAETVVGILILVKATIPEETIQNRMDSTFEKYANDSSEVQFNIDELQSTFECCGVRNYSDWAKYPYGQEYNTSVPDSCCTAKFYEDGCGFDVLSKPDVSDRIYSSGCSYVMDVLVAAMETALGIICIIFAVILIVSICCAFGLAANAGN